MVCWCLCQHKEVGWIDEDKIQTHAFPPGSFFTKRGIPKPDDWVGSEVWVCGVPAMYKALSGARDEPGLQNGSALHNLGYDASEVVKF